ncbi:MAG: phage tail tape measure protein [Desulfurellales bacterium]|nr:MAG: phage tail tape measure protein [Desulfurellales bacterium]
MDDRNAKIVISADTDQYTSSVNESYEATNRLNQALQQTTASMDGLVKRAGKKMIFFGTADLAALSSAVTVAATLDKQMSSLQAQFASAGRGTEEFGKMRDQIRAVSRELPVARGEVVQLYTAISKMGITSTSSLGKLTENFMKFGAASGESPTALAQSQIGLSRTMGTLQNGPGTIRRFNDEANTLSSKAGVSAQGILDFAQQLAPTARMANISQKDLLGISTAFNRAGADGGYAANAFNQIINNISQMRQSGDPNLRIYANKLGLSDKQIKSGNAADIFSTLVSTVQGQGEQGIATLNALGIDGLRTQRALQALTAEGSLPKWIKEGRAAYGDDYDSVEKGSKEAFSGLFDSIEKIKNNFTDLAQQLGQSVLPVVDKFAQSLASAAEIFATVMQPLTKILGPLMAGGGAALIAGGGLMKLWGAVATPAMARWAMNTRPGMGAKMGFLYGRNRTPSLVDMDENQLAYTKAMNEGKVGWFSRMMYGMGSGVGSLVEQGATRGFSIGQLLRQGFAGGMGLVRMFSDQTRQFYDQSTNRSGYEKVAGTKPRGFWASFGDAVRGRPLLTGDPQAIPDGPPKPRPPLLQDTKDAIARAGVTKGFANIAREAGLAAVSLAKIPFAAGRAAASMAGTGLGAMTRWAGRGLASAGSGLMNLLGGPWGLALGGAAAGTWLWKQSEKKDLAENTEGVTQGLSAYADKLGVATTSLTSFTDAVNKAKNVAGGYQSYKDVQNDASLADAARKNPTYTEGSPILSIRNNRDAIEWLHANEGEMTPEFLAQIKTDLYRRKQQNPELNINPDKIIDTYLKERKKRTPGENVDYNAALEGARQARDERSNMDKAKEWVAGETGTEGGIKLPKTGIDWLDDLLYGVTDDILGGESDPSDRNRSRDLKRNWADDPRLEEGVNKEYQRILTRADYLYDEYGGTKRGNKQVKETMRADLSSTLMELLKEGTPESVRAAERLYAKAAGDQPKQYGMDGKYDFSARDWENMSDEEIDSAFFQDRIVGKFDLNKLQQVGEDHLKGKLDRGMSVAAEAFAYDKKYKGLPGMGKFAMGVTDDPLFALAELRSGNPNLQYRAIQRVRQYAGNKDLLLADRRLDAMIANFGPDSPQGQWAQAAQAFNNQERSNRRSTMNMPGQVMSSINTWQSAMQSPNNTPGIDQKRLETQQAAKESILNLYQTLQQYDRSMKREEEDFYRSRAWSMEDFYRSRRQSTAAYHRQMLYAEKEFNISRQRMDEDYERGRRRAEADHNRGLRREEADYNRQKIWSITDYQRQQSYTLFDFQRQERIQKREFNISMQRSEEDYQRSVARSNFDFNLSRFRAYRDYNLSIQRSTEDFYRQREYGEQDFQKSRKRSTEDFNLSLSRSFEDYNKSRLREEEDHFIQLSRMSKDAAKSFYDPWLRVQSQATAGVDTFMENLRDQTERIQRQFENLKKLRSRGLSQDAIDMFGLADPNKAQQLQRVTVEMTDKQIAEINRLTKEREKGAKQLTQSDFNEQFRRMEEDREKSLRRGEEDFKLSIERSIADFQKSMARALEDYNLSLTRSAYEFNLSQQRSAEDFERSMKDSLEDYLRAMERGAEDFALSRRRSVEDFARSLSDSHESFRISLERADYEFQLSMDRQDKMRSIQLRRAEKDWERSLRFQENDYARSIKRMMQDRERQVDQSNKEFRISMQISNANFIRQLERSEKVRNIQLARAKQDLIGFGKDTFTGYDKIMKRLLDLTGKHMGSAGKQMRSEIGNVWNKLFNDGEKAGKWLENAYEKYIDIIIAKMKRATNKAATFASALARGLGSVANVGASSSSSPSSNSSSPSGITPPYGGQRALGGVALGSVNATVGEGGPELILPLNSRGMDYLTTALRQYAQADAMRLKSTQSMFYQQSPQGNLTQFNFGDVSVASDTPDQFYREMKQKESLKKLVGH